mgnify:CR=1 FL=1
MMNSKHGELTARTLATLGFREIVGKSELRFVAAEPSRAYDVAGNRTDIVNGTRARVMLDGHDIWVKVADKTPEAFEVFAFGDNVSLVEPEAVIYTRDGDRWPRVSFRAVNIAKADAQDEED